MLDELRLLADVLAWVGAAEEMAARYEVCLLGGGQVTARGERLAAGLTRLEAVLLAAMTPRTAGGGTVTIRWPTRRQWSSWSPPGRSNNICRKMRWL